MPICSIPLSSHLTTICPSIHSFIQPSIYPPPLCPALPPPPFLSSWSIYIYSPSPSHQQPVTTPPSTAAPHCLSCKYVLYIYHLHSYAAILKQNTRSVQSVYTKNCNICMNNAKLLICACVQTGPKGYIYIYISDWQLGVVIMIKSVSISSQQYKDVFDMMPKNIFST